MNFPGLSPEPGLSFFVYGTLKPCGVNYNRYCLGRVIQEQPAIARGALYHLDLGYPGLTLGNDVVQGWLLKFSDPAILTVLDVLETYDPQRSPEQNEYDRQTQEIFDLQENSLGVAWIYVMTPEKIAAHHGIYLPSGHWLPVDYTAIAP